MALNNIQGLKADGTYESVKSDGAGNLSAALGTALAGERNPTSETNAYLVTREEANATRLDIDQTETLVTAAPCHVFGLLGNEGNTGFTDLIDANEVGGGSTPIIRMDVAAGAVLRFPPLRFENGLCVDGESSGHDVTVFWRPIG